MQSGAGGNNPTHPGAAMEQNFQMQKQANGTALITPPKPVEKMISRDVKGNLGIVPIDTKQHHYQTEL